eukprot:Lankesteria_metandrocarpae@DN4222_c0_g1_i1.p1
MEAVHRLDYFFEVKRNRGFFTQYFINPHASIADLKFALTMLLCFVSVRFLLCGALRFPAITKSVALIPRIAKRIIKPKRHSKFSENVWYFMWHTTSFCWGVYVLHTEARAYEEPGWLRMLLRTRDDLYYWHVTEAEVAAGSEGWPLLSVSPTVSYFYRTQYAFWCSCVVFIWLETNRKDFVVLIIHHVATCSLILISYICSYWRIGLLILCIHDSADVFLYLAKFLHYTKASDHVVDAIFLVFVLVFFSSRLVIFPYLCVWPMLWPSNFRRWTGGKIMTHWDVPGGVSMPAFLFLLQILHVFWFCLIVKMIYRTLYTKKAITERGDVRSDDEDEVQADVKVQPIVDERTLRRRRRAEAPRV